jgi:hypothetical protein
MSETTANLEPPTDWQDPDWENPNRVHDWKNYISKELQAYWHTFTLYQKALIAKNAQELADREDWD